MSLPRTADGMAAATSAANLPVVIIGAGISGICMAIDLIRRNHSRNFIILEKSSQLGGTWNDNRYSGCCGDGKLVPPVVVGTDSSVAWSHLYSFSFNPNPYWKCSYPTQREIHAYLIDTARKWGLYKHIVFNTTVGNATWNGTEKLWRLKVATASSGNSVTDAITTPFLISAVGQLAIPQLPNIAGLTEFNGALMHSSRWDSNQKLEGKRVATIGTGATAVQIVPEVGKVASHLTVFQRSAAWILPRNNQNISLAQRLIYRVIPKVRKRYRAKLNASQDQIHDMIVKKEVSDFVGTMCLDHMRRLIPDNPTLWEKLTPTDPCGCKRVLLSDDLFPTLNQPHVTLETRPIDRITANGILVNGEEREFDIIILATGFRTTEFMHGIDVVGVGGRSIKDAWAKGGRAYLGMTVEDMPNFAMLYGPNTNLSHTSVILMIEAQARYISTMVDVVQRAALSGDSLSLTVKSTKLAAFNDNLQNELQKTIFADPGCNSWYKTDSNVVTNNWPGTAESYQELLRFLNWDDYEISGFWPKKFPKTDSECLGGPIEEESEGSNLPWQYLIPAAAFMGICSALGIRFSRQVFGKF